MKKLILSALIFLIPAFLLADSQTIGGQWLGLHNADASILIGDNEAQSLLNIDLSPGGSSILKRSGYSTFQTVGSSTIGVRGGYFFRNVSGVDTVVAANLNSIYASINGGTYSAFVTTDTTGSYEDFTDSQGFLWRANSNRDTILKWDGTTLTYYPSAPKGNQIEATADRLVISGTSGNPNRIYYSATADFTDFTTGVQDTSSFFEDVSLPGQSVQAIKSSCGGILAWTKDSTSLLTTQSGNDLNPTIPLSNTIGTTQPDTVVTDLGLTYWQGQDNHFYQYDCNVISRISQKLDVSGIVSGNARSWLTSSQAEFTAGTVGSGVSVVASPGDVTFSTNAVLDSFTDGDFTSNPAWTQTGGQPGDVTISASQAKFNVLSAGPFSDEIILITTNPVTNGVGSWQATFTGIDYQDERAGISISTFTYAQLNASRTALSYSLCVTKNLSTGVTNLIITGAQGGCSGAAALVTTAVSSSTVAGTFTLQLTRSNTNVLRSYLNGVFISSTTNSAATSGFNYVTIGALTYSASSVLIDDVGTQSLSGTYQSIPQSIGTAITSWGQVNYNNALTSGTITYALYSDTDTVLTTSDPTTWTSSQTITSGSIPTIATAPFLTWTAVFSRTDTSQNATLNDFTVNWNEGVISRHYGVVDKDHRIIWSVAEGTATVANVSYIFDPRFQTWLKYSFPMNAPARVGTSIYFGDTTIGRVYQWPSGNTDVGNAITAYWQSKDFVSPDPFVEKTYAHFSLVGKSQSGSNLDISMYLNGGTSPLTANYSLTESLGNAIKRINRNIPSGTTSSFVSWKFGNDDGDSPFQIYTFGYLATPKPWREIP